MQRETRKTGTTTSLAKSVGATSTPATKLAPDRATGWIYHSHALHELKRTAEARDGLLPVEERFPGDATMRYNLACYAAQLGDLPAARAWLKQAFAASGHDQQLKLAALDDPDLEPLWQEIGSV